MTSRAIRRLPLGAFALLVIAAWAPFPLAADSPKPAVSATTTPYLNFVRDTVDQLYERQSARLGDQPEGALFLAVSDLRFRTVRSLGTKTGDTYQTYLFQDPETGLAPHCFKALTSDDPDQTPNPFANVNDSVVGVVLLSAALELARRPEGERLAEQVRALGLRLLQGLAQHGFEKTRSAA